MLREQSVLREPGLSFRWIVVACEDGKLHLRRLCSQGQNVIGYDRMNPTSHSDPRAFLI